MKIVYRIAVVSTLLLIMIDSCKPSQVVLNKSGGQLWAETCTRCHYAPPSVDFDDHEWDLIGMHMQIKAQLTSDEVEKIVLYLKDTN